MANIPYLPPPGVPMVDNIGAPTSPWVSWFTTIARLLGGSPRQAPQVIVLGTSPETMDKLTGSGTLLVQASPSIGAYVLISRAGLATVVSNNGGQFRILPGDVPTVSWAGPTAPQVVWLPD